LPGAKGSEVSIPNVITVLRFFLVPVVVWLIIDGDLEFAFIAFLAAGISDGLDGYLAKRFNWQTELGAYLDPIADKLLLVSIYVVLGLFSHLPVWLVISVVTRDIFIVGAFLLSWVIGRPMEVRPLLISKVNTTGQILLATVVLADLGFSLGLGGVTSALVWITGILTILSAAAYMIDWLHAMAAYEPVPPMPKRRRRGSGNTSSGSGQKNAVPSQ
jgi:cardiolipin synthase (CMP-forming)